MLFRLALKNMNRNRRRTAAILLTVALGSASIFLFRGFNHGIMNQYRENTVHSRYGHGQLNLKNYRDQVFEKPWEHWIPNGSEIVHELKNRGLVNYGFPRIEFFGLLTNGNVTVSGRGQGVDGVEETKFFTTLNITNGVALSDQKDGIVLGRGLAKSLQLNIGDRVTVLVNTVHGSLNGADFKVAGIFHTGSKEFDDMMFRIPLEETMKLLDTSKIETISVGFEGNDTDSQWQTLARFVNTQWPDLEATPFNILDQVYYQHSVDWLGSQFQIIQMIILTIVILGIFNTVSTGIFERKSEIGNLRANGESIASVLLLLAYEGVILGTAGALLGLAMAFSLERLFLSHGILMPPAPGLTRQFNVLIEFEFQMALMAFLLSGITALLATLLASLKITRLSIAESLRSL